MCTPKLQIKLTLLQCSQCAQLSSAIRKNIRKYVPPLVGVCLQFSFLVGPFRGDVHDKEYDNALS